MPKDCCTLCDASTSETRLGRGCSYLLPFHVIACTVTVTPSGMCLCRGVPDLCSNGVAACPVLLQVQVVRAEARPAVSPRHFALGMAFLSRCELQAMCLFVEQCRSSCSASPVPIPFMLTGLWLFGVQGLGAYPQQCCCFPFSCGVQRSWRPFTRSS